MRGIAMKAGQVAASFPGADGYQALVEGIEPLPVGRIRPQIEASMGRTIEDAFVEFSPRGLAASLGQVHRAVLHDGSTVAVKVRYPGIVRSVRAEMGIAGLLPNVGPPKIWGFDLNRYRSLLETNMRNELDYLSEAGRQAAFAGSVIVPGLVVPAVHQALCREDLLVQSWEEGVPLREAASWPLKDRLLLGQTLLRTFFTSLFVTGEVHADPHPGNLLFRRDASGEPQAVLLDFGSMLSLSVGRRLALLRLVLSIREGDESAIGPCLVDIGFDPSKLLRVGSEIPAYCRLLLEPWVCDRPFALSGWKLSERSDELLGELRWGFRASAPADILLFVRTLFGLMRQVEELGVRLIWWPVLKSCVPAVVLDAARRLPLEPVEGLGGGAGAPGLARHLRVRITEGDRELFLVTMPATEVYELEQAIPGDVRDRLQASGTKLREVVGRIRRTGLVPQEVFETTLGKKSYRVWMD
jgi:predicted unusual protein kinase regulating ubiquinone biosynthesis (AarF/ABC1/UbiB family)